MEEIAREYQRIRELFTGIDENTLVLIDGAIWETARLKIELDELHQIVKETGLVRVAKENPLKQKELPVSKIIIKARANYLNHIAKLAGILGRQVDKDDDELEEYE